MSEINLPGLAFYRVGVCWRLWILGLEVVGVGNMTRVSLGPHQC